MTLEGGPGLDPEELFEGVEETAHPGTEPITSLSGEPAKGSEGLAARSGDSGFEEVEQTDPSAFDERVAHSEEQAKGFDERLRTGNLTTEEQRQKDVFDSTEADMEAARSEAAATAEGQANPLTEVEDKEIDDLFANVG